MDRLTAQALRLPQERLTVRDLFRVLWVKLHLLPPHTGAVPRALLEGLRLFGIYRHRSLYQLRHFARRALQDPRCGALVATTVTPPIDAALGAAVREALPALREVVVIPGLSKWDPDAVNAYLGLAAAQVFGPRFTDGQRIGLGGGRAVFAFAQALPSHTAARSLRFFALTRFHGALVFVADAEKAISELVVNCHWRHANGAERRAFEGIVTPRTVQGCDLDWAFIGIGALTENAWRDYADELVFDLTAAQQAGAVAEVLFHFFAADGTAPRRPVAPPAGFETVSLSVLRDMVRLGRPVVALAGGKEKATAVLAVYRSHRIGGALFNCLVTDEDCAVELLRRAEKPHRLTDVPDRAAWWERKHRFLVAHLKHSAPAGRRTNADIAAQLGVPRKKVQRWLREATEGARDQPPLLSFTVRVPAPEYALEIALVRRYGLQDARVVPPFADLSERLVEVGLAAAQLLCALLRDRKRCLVGLGSGYEVRAMVECLGLPETLHQLGRLEHLEFWALAESPVLTLSQGVSAQAVVSSVALRCGTAGRRPSVRCYRFDPHRDFTALDAAFFTLRASQRDDIAFLQAAGLLGAVPVAPVGCLLNQLFDECGNPLLPDAQAKSVPVAALRALTERQKFVVALNARCERVEAEAAALQVACTTGVVNALVITRPVAEALLRSAPP